MHTLLYTQYTIAMAHAMPRPSIHIWCFINTAEAKLSTTNIWFSKANIHGKKKTSNNHALLVKHADYKFNIYLICGHLKT